MCFGKKQNAFSVSSVELQKNEEIDKMIRKDRKRMKKEIKILLLGKNSSASLTTPTPSLEPRLLERIRSTNSLPTYRCRRVGEIYNSKADEDSSRKWL